MQLDEQQIGRCRRDGYLVLPDVFDATEVAAFKADLERIQAIHTDHRVRERLGGEAKTIDRVHEADCPTASPPFHRAVRSPRLLRPARQLAGDEALYIHHTKCNLKTAIDGSVWQWHQDYGTWRRDGIREPKLTTALIMLDEPIEIGDCLHFIPGSHSVGPLEPSFDESTGYKFWVVPKPMLLEIMARHPAPVATTGRPGTVVFVDCHLVHASGHNLSAHDRWQVYVVYNPVTNRLEDVPGPRPDCVRSRNWAPLAVEATDAGATALTRRQELPPAFSAVDSRIHTLRGRAIRGYASAD